MLTLLAALLISLSVFQSSHCYWSPDYSANFSISQYDAMDGDFHRSKRAMTDTGDRNRYIYYSDMFVDGSGSALAVAYLQNITSLPVSVTVNREASVLSITSIEVTTECNVTDEKKTCICHDGYSWNISVCFFFTPCNFTDSCACVVTADDNIPVCEEPFSGPESRVSINGSFSLKQNYTSDLTNTSSDIYNALAYNITGELIKAYASISQLLKVTVLGFSGEDEETTVSAKYQMTLRQPITTESFVQSNTAASRTIPNVISSKVITTGLSSILSTPNIIKYHDPFALHCQINDVVPTMIWWLEKNGTRDMICTVENGNAQITMQTTSSTTNSTLNIFKADQVWEGTYICQFKSGTVFHEDRVDIDVMLLPADIIESPIQQSVRNSPPLFLQCCIEIDGETYNVTWTNDTHVLESVQDLRTDLQCYNLMTPAPANDTLYNCTFTNRCNQAKSKSIPISVIKDKFCRSDGNGWNDTKAGITSIINCPIGKIGNMTRNCSLHSVWGDVIDNCVMQELNSALKHIDNVQQGLGMSQDKVPQIIGGLPNASEAPISNTAELSTMVTILGKISNISANRNNTFDSDVVTKYLSVASEITSTSFESPLTAIEGPPTTSMLTSVERFTHLLDPGNETLDIALPNIQLKGASFDPAMDPTAYQKNFNMSLTLGLYIDNDTIANLTNRGNISITTVVYASLGNILPKTSGTFENSELNSLVQSTSIKFSDTNEDVTDFGLINMTFSINKTNQNSKQHCVFWNFSMEPAGGWSDEGCSGWSDENGTHCSCNHLTSFAVLMSINPEPLFLINEITYVGLGLSIISLCVCLAVEWIVWKYVAISSISFFRHTSLVNIAFSLLCADICFLAASFPYVIKKRFVCLTVTFLNHFFYLSLFFWTLCQSLMLLHQLVFLFHHLRKKVFLSLSFSLGYACPTVIAMGTFVYFFPKNRYTHQTICWLNPDSGAILTFAIPAGSIIVFNFLTLIVVISKLTRPSVSDSSPADDKETAKSVMKAILVLTPVFGLTWVFGFALLKDLDALTKKIFTYGFAGLNAFQGFFILLTTCFTEKKVRDAFCKRMGSMPLTMSTYEPQTKMAYSNSLDKK